MIIDIVTDEKKLSKASTKVIKSTKRETVKQIIENLLDTARSEPRCLGLASNQIGHYKRIFVFKWGSEFIVAINPEIISTAGGTFPSYEYCLSRPGREPIKVQRHKRLKVSFLNSDMVTTTMKLQGRDAVEFQHELDHLNGILI